MNTRRAITIYALLGAGLPLEAIVLRICDYKWYADGSRAFVAFPDSFTSYRHCLSLQNSINDKFDLSEMFSTPTYDLWFRYYIFVKGVVVDDRYFCYGFRYALKSLESMFDHNALAFCLMDLGDEGYKELRTRLLAKKKDEVLFLKFNEEGMSSVVL